MVSRVLVLLSLLLLSGLPLGGWAAVRDKATEYLRVGGSFPFIFCFFPPSDLMCLTCHQLPPPGNCSSAQHFAPDRKFCPKSAELTFWALLGGKEMPKISAKWEIMTFGEGSRDPAQCQSRPP